MLTDEEKAAKAELVAAMKAEVMGEVGADFDKKLLEKAKAINDRMDTVATSASEGKTSMEEFKTSMDEIKAQMPDSEVLSVKHDELQALILDNAGAIAKLAVHKQNEQSRRGRHELIKGAVNQYLVSDKFKAYQGNEDALASKMKIEFKDVSYTNNYAGFTGSPPPPPLTLESGEVTRYPYQIRTQSVRNAIPSENAEMPFVIAEKVTNFINRIGTLGENVSSPELTFDAESVQFDAKRLAAHIIFSKNMLRSSQSIIDHVNRAFPRMYGYQEDFLVLRGDGNGTRPLGIMSDPDVRTLLLSGSYVATDITSIEDLSTGWVLVNFAAPHGLTDGYDITFALTTNYNATYEVSSHSKTAIAIEATYVAEATVAWTGTFASPFYLDIAVPNIADAIGVGQVHLANGQIEPTMSMANPIDLKKLSLEKDTDGKLLGRVDILPGGRVLVDGLPVISNSAVQRGQVYIGDFSQWSKIWDYQDVVVRMSETVGTDEIENRLRLIIESQIIVANYNPLAFMKVDIAASITDLTRP